MKIVQITSCHVVNSYAAQYNWILHALDDQGRIWERTDMSDWSEIKLPQPASAPETPALCPHGMPLAENTCGPCSEGRPNSPTTNR